MCDKAHPRLWLPAYRMGPGVEQQQQQYNMLTSLANLQALAAMQGAANLATTGGLVTSGLPSGQAATSPQTGSPSPQPMQVGTSMAEATEALAWDQTGSPSPQTMQVSTSLADAI